MLPCNDGQQGKDGDSAGVVQDSLGTCCGRLMVMRDAARAQFLHHVALHHFLWGRFSKREASAQFSPNFRPAMTRARQAQRGLHTQAGHRPCSTEFHAVGRMTTDNFTGYTQAPAGAHAVA